MSLIFFENITKKENVTSMGHWKTLSFISLAHISLLIFLSHLALYKCDEWRSFSDDKKGSSVMLLIYNQKHRELFFLLLIPSILFQTLFSSCPILFSLQYFLVLTFFCCSLNIQGMQLEKFNRSFIIKGTNTDEV